MTTNNSFFTLLRAVRASNISEDGRDLEGGEEENAAKRKWREETWRGVFGSMLTGAIALGSRQPTRAPVWVTLEVLPGGFASGRYLAALKPGDTSNAYFFTDEGVVLGGWALFLEGGGQRPVH